MVIAAGGAYAVAATGGDLNNSHTFTGDGHDHGWHMGGIKGPGTDISNRVSSTAITGTTSSDAHTPPYYALALIMYKGP